MKYVFLDRILEQFSRFRGRNPYRSRKCRARECTYFLYSSLVVIIVDFYIFLIGIPKINCVVNGKMKIDCLRKGKEVYMPFNTFIKDYFEVRLNGVFSKTSIGMSSQV